MFRKTLLIPILLLCVTGAIFAQPVHRIKFARNSKKAIVTGSLKNYKATVVYLIRVNAGQKMNVEQMQGKPDMHTVTLSITDPKGEDVTDMDASCNNRKEVPSTMAGDYKIHVAECMKVDRWQGAFRLVVRVE